MRRALVGVVFAIAACSKRGPEPFVAPSAVGLETIADGYAARGELSGSLLVMRGDEVLLRKAYGEADRQRHVANTPGTRFRIAQVEKLLTATLMMRLVERGLVDLDTPVRVYLDEFRPNDVMPITVRHLLMHRSGLASDQATPPASYDVDAILAKKRDADPGTRFANGSTDYVLLARLVAVAMQDTYANVLMQQITAPTEMRDTVPVGEDDASAIAYANGTPEPPYDADRFSGAADLVSTTTDLARFAKAFVGNKLLNAEMRATMLTPVNGAAFGCWVSDVQVGGRTLHRLSRSGALGGAAASLAIIDDRDLVVVLDNAGDTSIDALVDDLVAALAAQSK